jgi:hypothetical protein
LLTQNLCTTTFDSKPRNLKVHNLCQDPSSTPPPAVLDALGLDLGFCLSLPREDSNPIDFDRFRRDIRIRYTFRNEEDSDYNRKLYVKNEEWEPNQAPPNIEDAINKFEAASGDAFRQSRHYKHDYNIDPRTIQQLRQLKKDGKLMVTATDKNLGPAIMETSLYFRRSLDDHLLNKTQYAEISAGEAFEYDECNYRRILRMTVDDLTLDDDSKKFFERKLCGDRDDDGVIQRPEHIHMPYFYILPKVHKTPWKTRPVVSGVSTVNEPLSKWIDYHLQQVIHLCPGYLKDSWQLLRDFNQLPPIPDDAIIYTADAVSMYTNIDNDHGIESIGRWFDLHAAELPPGFPIQKILAGLDIIMRNNIFTFGNRCWKQLNGTAMGTPCACAYATIYYSYFEETALVTPDNPHGILFYRRLIDDALIIQRDRPGAHDRFLAAMNSFGNPGARLEWESSGASRSDIFLDFTLKLNDRHGVDTQTYQKPMNLYLYRPPSSAQPPSILYGLIYGTLHRYYWQNNNRCDFDHFSTLFFRRLEARGHSTSNLARLFTKAAKKVELSTIPQAKALTSQCDLPRDTCFLHLPFHPQDSSRQSLQSLFQTHCRAALDDDEDTLNIQRMIIAYKRSPNISDLVRRRRLGPDIDTHLSSSVLGQPS